MIKMVLFCTYSVSKLKGTTFKIGLRLTKS